MFRNSSEKRKQMQAAVLSSPRNVRLQSLPRPKCGVDQVLVRVEYCGLSGTCVRSYQGTFPGTVYPVVPGLEVAGIVETCGSEVVRIIPGQRVAIEPVLSCGRCYACRVGRYNCCSSLNLIGVHQSGGMAEYVAVPASRAYPVPAGLSALTAALCEPFSIGVQACSRANVHAQASVVLFGAGVIGLTILMVASGRGARVLVIDPNPRRLQFAKDLGASEIFAGDAAQAIPITLEFTSGDGAEVVIDATGVPEAIAMTTKLAAPAGCIAIVGVSSEAVPLSMLEVVRKELDIVGVRNCCGRFEEAVQFVATHVNDVERLISRTVPLKEVAEAFQWAENHTDELRSVIAVQK